MAERTIELKPGELQTIVGPRDETLRTLRTELGIKLIARDELLKLEGTDDQIARCGTALDYLRGQARRYGGVSSDDIQEALQRATPSIAVADPTSELRLDGSEGGVETTEAIVSSTGPVQISGPLRRLHARTPGQGVYIQAIREHDLTFGIGPAGSGKTFLAVAAALEALQHRRVRKLVLCRPAVEAGEKLGFLPGDMQAKVNPYIRPLLDALGELLDFHQVRSYLENDIVEICPLAFMRGRTLNDAFIILDEAQNTTVPQMQMFLTRMGMGSKIVVTGDVTQVDLPSGVSNGLRDAMHRFRDLKQVAQIRLGKEDIVRHPLVQAIVQAYEPANRAENE